MKNLTVLFLAIMLVFSVVFLPSDKVYAQYSNTTNTQNTASLELQMNALQKELIVLLNKKVAMLQTELNITLAQRLKNLQVQLIGLLEKQVSILRSQLASR